MLTFIVTSFGQPFHVKLLVVTNYVHLIRLGDCQIC